MAFARRAYTVVSLDELVDAPPTGDPRVHLRPTRRNGMTIIPLTQRAGGIQALVDTELLVLRADLDLRHVAQLLHAASVSEQLGTTALTAWPAPPLASIPGSA